MTLHRQTNTTSVLVKVRLAFALIFVTIILIACDNNHSHDPETTEARAEFGDEYWAELAQTYEPFVTPPLGSATPPEEFQFVGQWGEVIDWPLIATGAANLPDGRVLAWSSQKVDDFGGISESTHGTIYDPNEQSFSDTPSSSHDMFCSGVSMLEDGRVFVAGGGKVVATTSVFDATEFSEIESMALSRWYPTSTTLPSGQVLTSLGTVTAPYPELWTDGSGWNLLDEVNLETIIKDEDNPFRDWYPALNVAPDGSLFHPGHMPEILSVKLDDHDNHVHSHGENVIGEESRLYNTTVMYDIGKMLVAGGGTNPTNAASIMDLNGATPQITDTNPMHHARAMQNSVVLPNGEVLVIGGNTSGVQFSDTGTVLTPEIWNPVTEQWTVVSRHFEPRNYHSTALLLKDARVLAAGGGLCGACATNHQNGEIFTPPYLYDAFGDLITRPSIDGGDSEAFAGDTILLSGSDDIEKFNMVRLVAITHHHSTDQRFVPIDHVKTNVGEYSLTLNSNTNVLIPGYYWVFGLDQNGTPTSGHTVQVKVSTENQPTIIEDTTPNLEYEYYQELLFDKALPDFDSLTPVKTGTLANFSLTPKERSKHYQFRFRGTISVPVDGSYTFFLSSDDGSKLLINDQVVVDHDGPHPFEGEESGAITLTAGEHAIEVQYFELSGGDALLVSWEGPQLDKRPIRSSDFVVTVPPDNGGGPELGSAGMVSYSYYHGSWNFLPNFDLLTPVSEGEVAGFSLDPRIQNDRYGFVFEANLAIPTDGNYTFYTRSDDGSRLLINDTLVVNNDGKHGPIQQQGTIALIAGNHNVRVEFFEHIGGDSLVVEWEGPAFTKQVIPNTALSAIAVDDSEPEPEPIEENGTLSKLNYAYYEGLWPSLPDFDTLTPVKTGQSDGFTLTDREQDDLFAFVFTGKITIPSDGSYTFYTVSDDGSNLSINGQVVVDNDGAHAPRERQGDITLTAGEHNIEVAFFERGGGERLQVLWSGPGFNKEVIPLEVLKTNTIEASEASDGLINYEYFEGSWTSLPNFDLLNPVSSGQVTEFELSNRQQDDNYGFRYATTVTVTADDDYTFFTSSDDGSRLFVNGQLIVDNDGLHGNREESGTVQLTAGTHYIVVEFFERIGRDTLSVSWASSTMAKQQLSNAELSSASFD